MSTKTKIWTEELIRNELKRLDDLVYKKKGILLVGGIIPIKFNNRAATLGYFKTNPEYEFGFSLHFFNDDQFPEGAALDVIRHEYAHYYAYVVFGTAKHNKAWKAACQVVGASPSRFYTEEFCEYQKRLEEKESRIYSNRLCSGAEIVHKEYGRGVITNIALYRDLAVETVLFDSGLVKKLDEAWIIDHCEIISRQ